MLALSLLLDFMELIFPRYCILCDILLTKGENQYCIHCSDQLPIHDPEFNGAMKIFEGRAELNAAMSLLRYSDKLPSKTLITELKYKANAEIGIQLGRRMGRQMKLHSNTSDIDLIVPIPLNWLKKYKRGYNQSDFIAKGIAKELAVQVKTNFLVRPSMTRTQTRKSRLARLKNVDKAFKLGNTGLMPEHILLVDDVLTTGATMESAIVAIRKKHKCKISLATLCISDG